MVTERRLSEILVGRGLITEDDWTRASSENPEAPEQALLRRGLLDEAALAEAKAVRWRLPFRRLDGTHPVPDVLHLISSELLTTGALVPLAATDEVLTVAIADPDRWQLRDALVREAGGRRIELVVAPPQDIAEHLALPEGGADEEAPASDEDVRQLIEAPPVVRLVDLLISRAITEGASDIHVGNWGGGFETRYRIDGALYPKMAIPRRYYAGVISRLKVLAGLDIAEHRLPQDGEIAWPSRTTRRWDLRLVTMPSKRTEFAVIRIFGHEVGSDLASLGFSGGLLAQLDALTRVPHGIILATGPTGCGKTTTLATMVRRIQELRPEDSIYTVEEPVETTIPGAVQIQVNPKAQLTFARVLRSLLRADPDIMLIGEIRDEETARIAVQAALTGHLVLATLHTNDAAGAVARLQDMGIEPYLIADVLRAVIAQRLVRRVCERCREKVDLDGEAGMLAPGVSVAGEWRGRGCPACHQGYRGRLAIAELLVATPEVRAAIARRSTGLTELAGMRSMLADGVDKITAGLTTSAEVRRMVLATTALGVREASLAEPEAVH